MSEFLRGVWTAVTSVPFRSVTTVLLGLCLAYFAGEWLKYARPDIPPQGHRAAHVLLYIGFPLILAYLGLFLDVLTEVSQTLADLLALLDPVLQDSPARPR